MYFGFYIDSIPHIRWISLCNKINNQCLFAGFEVNALSYDFSATIEASISYFMRVCLWLIWDFFLKIFLIFFKSKSLVKLILKYIVYQNFSLILSSFFFQIQCLQNPKKPQYGGGIIINPDLDDGLKGWATFGDAKIQHRESHGNHFIVAHSRNQSYDSISQKLFLHKDNLYSFSGNQYCSTQLFQWQLFVLFRFYFLKFFWGNISMRTEYAKNAYNT